MSLSTSLDSSPLHKQRNGDEIASAAGNALACTSQAGGATISTGAGSSVYNNPICLSVYKVGGALTGAIVAKVIVAGPLFDVFRFCAAQAGSRARTLTCCFPTADACRIFERDTESFLETVTRGVGNISYTFAMHGCTGRIAHLHLRAHVYRVPVAHVYGMPLVTTHDLVCITRSGLQLLPSHDVVRLSLKPSLFAHIITQMIDGVFAFLPSCSAPSDSRRMADGTVAYVSPRELARTWQDLMLDGFTNVARNWESTPTSTMPGDWCCAICLCDHASSGADTAAILPCKHAFHTACIACVPALDEDGVFACPLCRRVYLVREM